MVGCVFCRIVDGTESAYVVDEDAGTMAFLDLNPIAPGHTLVVPKVHTDDLWSVDAETAAAIMRATHRVARLMQSVLALDGLNLLHATRAAAFQSVFHLHVHVVPRWDTDTLSEPPWPQPPGDPEQLADIASRLRAGSGRTNPTGPARGAGD